MAPIFRSCKNEKRFLKPLGREKNWLCPVWGQGETKCNMNNSPNTSLSTFCLNSNSNQMNPKPLGNLNHHMNLQHLTPCQVWKSNDKAKLHDDYKNCSWAVTALPNQHWISSRDLSMKQLGILETEMIFTLPRCFLLRVMSPLHLYELYGLVASLALESIKNTG